MNDPRPFAYLSSQIPILGELDQRSRDVFQRLVETFIQTGDPVGSRTISRSLPTSLSPASVRNVMADLESLGLIMAPHTSAGRMPTDLGLRMFVDGLLEFGDLTEAERRRIESEIATRDENRNVEDVLTEATNLLSGLSHCAGIVVTPKSNLRLKHLQFVPLEPTKALAVLVGEDGTVENRIAEIPAGLPASALTQASNYLNARIAGRTLEEVRDEVEAEITTQQATLDELTRKVIEAGLAIWGGEDSVEKTLIVRGRSHLLENLEAIEDLDRIRLLFDDLETKQDLIELLGLAQTAQGVRIFIGSENKLFSLSGSSLIVSPYRNTDQKIVGVLGVIGPTRLNYARIVPMVDYTAKVLGRILS